MQIMNRALALIGVLCISPQAQAGWLTVPSTGFGSSAYANCYNTGRTPAMHKGNFGSVSLIAAQYPSTGNSDACWTTAPSTEASLPPLDKSGVAFTGFTVSGSVTRSIPNPTGGASIGSVFDKYWRNPTTNTCLLATKIRMLNIDSDAAAGTQLFEVNDVVRSGFEGSGDVSIAYAFPSNLTPINIMSPVYRVGRTFTSVQHRSLRYDNIANKSLNGINYLDLPTANTVNAAVTGEPLGINAVTTATTTLAKQDAVVNANHIDFTMEVISSNESGYPQGDSPVVYIETSCTAVPTEQPGAIRLRQTGQENATMKAIDMTGYAIGTP